MRAQGRASRHAARVALPGRKPRVVDDGCWVIERLLDVLRTFALGVVPASNVVDKTVVVPVNEVSGALYIYQGSVTVAGETRRTDSVPVIVA